jgi:hypothetical protein
MYQCFLLKAAKIVQFLTMIAFFIVRGVGRVYSSFRFVRNLYQIIIFRKMLF